MAAHAGTTADMWPNSVRTHARYSFFFFFPVALGGVSRQKVQELQRANFCFVLRSEVRENMCWNLFGVRGVCSWPSRRAGVGWLVRRP